MRGLLGSLFGPAGGGEIKMSSRELGELLRGGVQSGSGAAVTWQTALQVTTMLACTRVIADGLAQVPWKVYRGEAGRVEAADHPLSDLLYRRPNPWQTSFEFREQLAFHLVLTGNAFVRKLRVGSARRLASLEPFEPGQMRVEREADGRLRYWFRPKNGSEAELPADEVWHLRGPSWNGWMGLDVTRLAREAIGLSIATEAAHADLHRNGARIAGMYTVADKLSPEKFEFLSKWMDRYEQGGDRAGKPFILDSGAKFERSQMSGVDAQHIETRKHQVEEVCRGVRVMPIMIGQADKAATYASAEQMFIAHEVHTMMPWRERIEQSADVNLLSEQDRAEGLYTKFNASAMMRGAAKDRGEFYAKALGAGGIPAWMTQDEVRGLEELAPMGGKAAELSAGAMNKPPAEAGGGNKPPATPPTSQTED